MAKPNKAERAHMYKVAMLPCCACNAPPPSEVHHCLGVQFKGMGQKSSHYETIPLCAGCHRNGNHAIHRIGEKAWQPIYGYQKEHLEKTLQTIKQMV